MVTVHHVSTKYRQNTSSDIYQQINKENLHYYTYTDLNLTYSSTSYHIINRHAGICFFSFTGVQTTDMVLD